jgi:hypothetical protein
MGVGFLGALVAACSGSTGPAGPTGATGASGARGAMGLPGASGSGSGSSEASISGITPPYAFQDRTVDISIAGTGTAWDAQAKVAFANAGVTVNKVTAASAAGLLVNIKISGAAPLGTTDVTVTDGASVTTYKGAFAIQAPLTVTTTPMGGVPQGGYGNLHVQMNDLTTPIDPDTFNVTVSSTDLTLGTPTPTDYAFDLNVLADILATTGTYDLTLTFGETATITSDAPQSFMIASRAPTALTAGTAATGNIETELDTELYSYAPASAAQQFMQFTTSSMAGTLTTYIVPKSGKYSDAIAGYAIRYAQGTTSTDTYYAVVGDSNGLFGPGPVPADTSITLFTSPCTAATEISETSGTNDDAATTAQAVTTLPALLSGTLGYGSVAATSDLDYYKITVPAGSTSLHVATGGDPNTDTLLTVYDSTGTNVVGTSDDMDLQEDLVVTVTPGTYYVAVSAGANYADPDNGYELFVATN